MNNQLTDLKKITLTSLYFIFIYCGFLLSLSLKDGIAPFIRFMLWQGGIFFLILIPTVISIAIYRLLVKGLVGLIISVVLYTVYALITGTVLQIQTTLFILALVFYIPLIYLAIVIISIILGRLFFKSQSRALRFILSIVPVLLIAILFVQQYTRWSHIPFRDSDLCAKSISLSCVKTTIRM